MTPVTPQLSSEYLALFRCPISGEALHQEGAILVSASGRHRYPISPTGIPLFAGDYISAEAKIQQQHYDRVVGDYVSNMMYPHTQAYLGHLDKALKRCMTEADWQHLLEVCCGHGEAFLLFGERVQQGVGIDISQAILEEARKLNPQAHLVFAQGDATRLPLEDGSFETVVMLGGIHHVNNRAALFQEVYRVLKPQGRFYWREPVSDFFLWRWLRAIIYRLSPNLDAETEHPLEYASTKAALEQAGFQLRHWQTHGLLGFMVFMNSDILVFNRLFRFIPGIRRIARWSAQVDDAILRLPGLSRYGLQVIGYAQKRG